MSKDSALTDLELKPSDANIMVRFVGELNENLKFVEKTFDVKIFQNGNNLKIKGSEENVKLSAEALERLYEAAGKGVEITKETLYLCIRDYDNKTIKKDIKIKTPKRSIVPRGKNQRSYIENIGDFDINFGIGPAGTGKTYLAVALAVDSLLNEAIDRIILIRPAVEAGEKLGFLPGDLSQKVDPYLRPLYDALYEMLGIEKTEKLLSKGVVEIAPLAYMRGRTLNNACIILDEAQNATVSQIKMFLTRLGEDSKMIITGDETQIDLNNKDFSGLKKTRKSLSNIEEISVVEFKNSDIVRNKIVSKILEVFPDR